MATGGAHLELPEKSWPLPVTLSSWHWSGGIFELETEAQSAPGKDPEAQVVVPRDFHTQGPRSG